jgi:hypothetical protein
MEPAVKSKATWGRRQNRTPEELRRLIDGFFSKVVVPDAWICQGRSAVKDADGDLLSEGYVFDDSRTSGAGAMKYKVVFVVAPERGAICERSIQERGDVKYMCVISNKTVEDINIFIESRYFNIEKE